ncbi:MAG: flagellar hook-associated protein FlgK [Alicyclobacillus macrosporangiidus]|uniref:flagellar hook-associated protein FlgK n=1 Tax=Alicyclobacillus macrosporangiidus TaxID=392015 RepID=UPI0026EBAE43|nr:flagellar hook-associated protein FlgK [Alicyclobacillus macrosporangiidus]MCL6598700.1 flagellar hook-associated protein FlgK [Alicyclobacillus macrosporangiidus]
MPSTFLPLQIGLSALQSSMLGVETAGHNIANANTPGYAREVVDNETLPSLEIYTDHDTYIGQGVNARGQNRIDDTSLDKQYWDNNTQQSYWQTLSTELNQVEQVFNEPSGTTLRQSIQGFFNAWDQLAQSPADMGARAAVYEASVQVAGAFQTTAEQLQQNYTRYQAEESVAANQFNTLLGNLAAINQQLISLGNRSGNSGSSGGPTTSAPNDLLDQRDALLDQLSQYAKLDVTYHNDGSVDVGVYINANVVAFGNTTPIAVPMVTGGTVTGQVDGTIPANASNAATNTVSVQDLLDNAGQLRSLYDMAQYIQNGSSGVLDQVNTLAQEFMAAVNNQFSQGYDLNGNQHPQLFTGTSASNMAVDPTFTSTNLDLLPAAGTNGAGGPYQTDGANAQAIADMMTTYETAGANLINGGPGPVVTYSGIVTQLGTDGQAANQKKDTFSALTTQVTSFRQSVRGVNINEEMASMVQYQQTYQAASRFIAVFNDMLNTLISEV